MGNHHAMAASDMLRSAAATHYMYPAHFPGFTADVHSHSRRGCMRGSMLYEPPNVFDFYPSGSSDGSDASLLVVTAVAELREIMTELWIGGMESNSLGAHVEYGEDPDPVGVPIVDVHDSDGLRYRVKEGRVSQVSWLTDEQRFTLTTLEFAEITDTEVLPRLRTLTRLSLLDGSLLGTSTIIDSYRQLEGFPIPAGRRVFVNEASGDTYDRDIHFSNPALLSVPDTWNME